MCKVCPTHVHVCVDVCVDLCAWHMMVNKVFVFGDNYYL